MGVGRGIPFGRNGQDKTSVGARAKKVGTRKWFLEAGTVFFWRLKKK